MTTIVQDNNILYSGDAIGEEAIDANEFKIDELYFPLPTPLIPLNNSNTIVPLGTINPYYELITSEHQQDKFIKLVNLLTQGFWDNTVLLDNFYNYFDINQAIGNQLDILGQWIGLSRYVTVPIDGAFFSFDITGLGFDEGYWDQALGTQNARLSDTPYRAVLKAKIALNSWDGTMQSAIDAFALALPNNPIYIKDNQDMSMTLMISGKLTPVNQALITHGYFDLRPAGVSIQYIVATKFFCWDEDNGATLGGWDNGEWFTQL